MLLHIYGGIGHCIPDTGIVHLQGVIHPKDNGGLSGVRHPGFHIHDSTHVLADGTPSCKGTIRLSNGSRTNHNEK